jgi:hypothetical protein
LGECLDGGVAHLDFAFRRLALLQVLDVLGVEGETVHIGGRRRVAEKADREHSGALLELRLESPGCRSQPRRSSHQMIGDFVNAYRAGGKEFLERLHDEKKPLVVKEQFEDMIGTRDLSTYFPSVHAFSKDYLKTSLPGGEQFFYWSKVDFGLKALVRLNHVVLYEPNEIEAVRYTVASKMIYTTHDFNTGLELKFLVVPPDSTDTYYLEVPRCGEENHGARQLVGSHRFL